MKLRYYKWLFEHFGILRCPIKELYPQIKDWHIGDKFDYKLDHWLKNHFYHQHCYLKSISSSGRVFVSAKIAGKRDEVLEIYDIKDFIRNTINISLKEKRLAAEQYHVLNDDNILK